ncbi:hypothetical protein SAMN05216553_12443 [Lentzea fradiae]|uniref:Uncharacterized protein n=1 Tax=Lentzea fradiae TaxID=200378 RepID=A0A1G8CTS5_9PSEU|nr:hypothetical protein [Lentzea fradiae]SDH48902.1 hypothetical protein SAMN05216553_12443 [Lentzea fradiae]
MPALQAVVRHDDVAEYERTAAGWRPGEAFPVLDGAALTRYEDVLRAEGRPELPAVTATAWPGAVASLGAAATHAAGALLAAATSRPHHRTDLTSLGGLLDSLHDVPVALVATADDLADLGDWPGMRHPGLGVVTARSAESLSCLIYRTLTVQARASSRDVVVTHPMAAGADEADAVALDELRPLVRGPVTSLRVLSHGRECCLLLPDGLVCGRGTAEPPADVDPALRVRLPSCLRGEGCWRQDLGDEDRIAASSIDTRLAFLQTCSSVAVGNNAHPPSVGVGLGFLEGTTVAVVGTIGLHVAYRPFYDDLAGALHGGARLGEAVARLNQVAVAEGGESARFGLLGDPALPVDVPASITREARRAPEVEPVDDQLIAAQTVLGRLRSLLALELPLDEGRLTTLEQVARRGLLARGQRQVDALREVRQGVDELQSSTTRELVHQVHDTWWGFFGDRARAFRQVDAVPVACPQCGRDSAVRVEMAHRLPVGLTVFALQCRRCGDLSWSTARTPAVELTTNHVVHAPKVQDNGLTGTFANRGDTAVLGHVGFAFVAGGVGDLPRGRSRPVHVPGGATARETWRFRLDERVQAAERYAVVTGLVEGEHQCSYVFVNVLPRDREVR